MPQYSESILFFYFASQEILNHLVIKLLTKRKWEKYACFWFRSECLSLYFSLTQFTYEQLYESVIRPCSWSWFVLKCNYENEFCRQITFTNFEWNKQNAIEYLWVKAESVEKTLSTLSTFVSYQWPILVEHWTKCRASFGLFLPFSSHLLLAILGYNFRSVKYLLICTYWKLYSKTIKKCLNYQVNVLEFTGFEDWITWFSWLLFVPILCWLRSRRTILGKRMQLTSFKFGLSLWQYGFYWTSYLN